jgi:hypothetical protein
MKPKQDDGQAESAANSSGPGPEDEITDEMWARRLQAQLSVGRWKIQQPPYLLNMDYWDLVDKKGDVYNSGERLEMIAEAERLDRLDQIKELRKLIRDQIDQLEDNDTQAVLDYLTLICTRLDNEVP